jgi:hypothetical protein
MDRIEVLPLQELRERIEQEQDAGAPHIEIGPDEADLILAVLDERDARLDAVPEPEGLRSAALSMRACADGEEALAAQLVERARIMRAAADDIDAALARPAAAEGVDAGVIYTTPDEHGAPVLRFGNGVEATPDDLWQHILESMPAEHDVVRLVLASDDGEQADG